MTIIVKTRIVKIGNSQGIKIPKILIDQANLGENVALEVEEGYIIIRPGRPVRAGWAKQFKKMAEANDDKPIDLEVQDAAWDEWEW